MLASMNGWFRRLATERFQRLGREALWIALGQAAAVIGSLVGVRLITELLNPSTYGELALGMTLATLVNQTILGPLGNGATRFYIPAVEANDLISYLRAVRRLVLSATALIISILFVVVVGLLIARRTEWIAIGIAAIAFALFNGYNSVLDGILNAARQRAIVAFHQGIASWVRFLIAAGLILWLGTTSAVAMSGYALALILVLASQFAFFRKNISKNANIADKERDWQQEIWMYSWPFATWGIFYWAQSASDRWALGLFTETRDVGQYAVLYQLGSYPMTIAIGMFVKLLAPILFERSGDGTDSQRNANVNRLGWRLTGLALSMTGAIFFATLILHEQIFRVLVAKDYMSVSYLLPWMLLAGGVFAAGETIALNLMSRMKTRMMITAKVATALLGTLLNFVGAYMYGILGIIMANIVFSVSYALWMTMLSRRIATTSNMQ